MTTRSGEYAFWAVGKDMIGKLMAGDAQSDDRRRGGPSSALRWRGDEPPFSTRFDDHYYSRHDGRAECAHVFLAGNDLPARWRDRERFVIGELGFGTGLNMTETWRLWKTVRQPGQALSLVSIEAYPLAAEAAASALGAWPELAVEREAMIRHWPALMAGQQIDLDDSTTLCLLVGEAEDRLSRWDGRADAWFLDGFAPKKNPDLWSGTLMRAVFDHTVPGGSFATYTAAGWVRRNLMAAGFTVEKRPGHAGKRDMCVGWRD